MSKSGRVPESNSADESSRSLDGFVADDLEELRHQLESDHSPEQAAGDLDQITSKSDVYSIGATLYAMLTGHPPFQSSNTVETMRMVLEREPIPPRQLNPAIPIDLSTICLKCLQKNPAERYWSAAELAADLRRFLDDQPVRARMPSRAVRSVRWCRRRPVAATLVLLLLGLAIAGPLVAIRQASLNQEALSPDESLLAVGDFDGGITLIEIARQPVLQHWQAHPYRTYSLRFSADGTILASASVDDEAALWSVPRGQLIRKLPGDRAITVSPDGNSFAYRTEGMSIAILDDLQSEPRLMDGTHDFFIADIAFSPDGKILATACNDGTVRLWRAPRDSSPRSTAVPATSRNR